MRNFFALAISMTFAASTHADTRFSTDWDGLIASSGPYVMQSQLTSTSSGKDEYGVETALWHDPTTGTDWAVIGAPFENSGAGAVYIYSRRTTTSDWTRDAQIVPSDASPHSEFGAAVAFDGVTLLVGAPAHINDMTIGAAYLFARDPVSGAWAQQGDELNARIGAFGSAVAVSGDQLAIADPFLNRVYPYERTGGTWAALTPIEAPSEMFFFPRFGTRLWMNETELLVGAPNDNHSKVEQGSCALYTFSRDAWDLRQILRPTIDTSSQQFFCYSVTKSAHGIVVGSPHADSDAGALNFFIFDDIADKWVQQAKIAEPASDTTTPPLPMFGSSVATDGEVLVAGTPGRDRAMVFRFRADAWVHDSTLTGNSASLFGDSVSAANGVILMGAISDGDKGQGAAYVFLNDRIFADGFGN